jgi:hypothetical protein
MPIRKRKWFIPVVVTSVLLIVGGITGGMMAAADSVSGSAVAQNQTASQFEALLDKACTIYREQTGVAINATQLKDALEQARSETQGEALETWLQNLVKQGKITQEQADQYLQWWQSRPDVSLPLPGPGGHGRGGGMFQAWGAP